MLSLFSSVSCFVFQWYFYPMSTAHTPPYSGTEWSTGQAAVETQLGTGGTWEWRFQQCLLSMLDGYNQWPTYKSFTKVEGHLESSSGTVEKKQWFSHAFQHKLVFNTELTSTLIPQGLIDDCGTLTWINAKERQLVSEGSGGVGKNCVLPSFYLIWLLCSLVMHCTPLKGLMYCTVQS